MQATPIQISNRANPEPRGRLEDLARHLAEVHANVHKSPKPWVLQLKRLRTWEEKLVFYADKLVEGHAIVTTQERLKALRMRYQPDEDLFGRCETPLHEMEIEICTRLGLNPLDLIDRLARMINFRSL